DMFADKVVVFDNLGDGTFLERLIDDSLDGAAAVDIGLIYSSTILDIVATGRFDNKIRLYRHFGEWTFMTYLFENEANNKFDVVIASDTSFSIFSSSVEGNVTYWEADLIEEYTWTPHTISQSECNVDHLTTAYINGDPMDIVGTSRESGKVYWWDGDSEGSYTEHEILSGIHLNAFDIADLDQDEDQDLLCATTSGDLLWYENIRGEEHTEHTITAGMQYPFDIEAADINMDGFMDFVIADTYADEISWWRNTGNGHFRRNIIVDDFTQARALEVVDFDDDGDIDIVGAGQNGIMLWRNDLIIPEEEPSSAAKLIKPIIPNDDILTETPSVGNDLPKEFALYANHPNPFNATTTISFSLPIRSEVSLTVHDVLGRTTETLVAGSIEAGSHSLNWSCPDCATGVYFVVMQTAEFRAIQKALLIK
ncbi:T9SS type A sorting domain-containing protein, partial [bacterium]|nr:T9SS type A sorting domain-containing protein [bacterium]